MNLQSRAGLMSTDHLCAPSCMRFSQRLGTRTLQLFCALKLMVDYALKWYLCKVHFSEYEESHFSRSAHPPHVEGRCAAAPSGRTRTSASHPERSAGRRDTTPFDASPRSRSRHLEGRRTRGLRSTLRRRLSSGPTRIRNSSGCRPCKTQSDVCQQTRPAENLPLRLSAWRAGRLAVSS